MALYDDDNGSFDLVIHDGENSTDSNKVLGKGRLYGHGADGSEGSGIDTIKLIPDIPSYNDGSDQYVIIEPTGPNHVHIRSGGVIGSSTADLFLGGERNNVIVSDPNDSVTISADAGDDSSRTWTFNGQGELLLPIIFNGTAVISASYGTELEVNAGNSVDMNRQGGGITLNAGDGGSNTVESTAARGGDVVIQAGSGGLQLTPSDISISAIDVEASPILITMDAEHNLTSGQKIWIFTDSTELSQDYYVSVQGTSTFTIYKDRALTEPEYGVFTPYSGSGGYVTARKNGGDIRLTAGADPNGNATDSDRGQIYLDGTTNLNTNRSPDTNPPTFFDDPWLMFQRNGTSEFGVYRLNDAPTSEGGLFLKPTTDAANANIGVFSYTGTTGIAVTPQEKVLLLGNVELPAGNPLRFGNLISGYYSSFQSDEPNHDINYILPNDQPSVGQVLAASNVTGTGPYTVTLQWVEDQTTPAGEGITSLNGETLGSQSFADDTNVTITSSMGVHSLGWTGSLAAGRGGTGQTSYSEGELLIGNSGGGLTKATLTAGTGISIANGDGAITIAAEVTETGITSLNGLTGTTQTFVNDTNVTLTSTSTTHTLGWTGSLAVGRGGTGATTFAANTVLYGNGASEISTTGTSTAVGAILTTDTAGGAPAFSNTLAGNYTVSGNLTISGNTTITQSVEKFSNYTSNVGSGATVTLNSSTSGNILYVNTGTVSGNWTLDVTNLNMSSGMATAVTAVISQGATAYMPTVLKIDGTTQSVSWQGGGSVPSGNTNKVDSIIYSVLCTGTSTYVVLGQLVSFG